MLLVASQRRAADEDIRKLKKRKKKAKVGCSIDCTPSIDPETPLQGIYSYRFALFLIPLLFFSFFSRVVEGASSGLFPRPPDVATCRRERRWQAGGCYVRQAGRAGDRRG